jgi:hypothetical protein
VNPYKPVNGLCHRGRQKATRGDGWHGAEGMEEFSFHPDPQK